MSKDKVEALKELKRNPEEYEEARRVVRDWLEEVRKRALERYHKLQEEKRV